MSLNNRRDVQKFRAQPAGKGPTPSDGKLFDDEHLDEASRQAVMRDVQKTSTRPKSLTPAQQQQINELLHSGGTDPYQRHTVGAMSPAELVRMMKSGENPVVVDPRASAQSQASPISRHSAHSVGVSTNQAGDTYVLPPSPSRNRSQSIPSVAPPVPASSKVAPSTGAQLPPPTQSKAASYQRNTVGGDGDLLGVMVQRLRTLENSQRVMQLELKEKSRKVIELEDRCTSERVARKEAEEAKEALAQELADVLEFLQEYGLSWVGKDVDEISDHGDASATSMPPLRATGGHTSGGRVLGRHLSSAGDEDEVGVHANIVHSTLSHGSGLAFENTLPQTEEGRSRGGRSSGDTSAAAIQQFRHDQQLKDPLVAIPLVGNTPPTATEKSRFNVNQRTVHTGTDGGPSSDAGGFNIYDGEFDAKTTTDVSKVDAEPASSSSSALPASVIAAQQQRHQQYLEEKKGQPLTAPFSNAPSAASTRKLKKLPFSLERFIKNCGILSDHVGEKAFADMHSDGAPPKSGAVGATLATGASPVPSENTGIAGGGARRRVLQEREKVYVVIYNDGICVNGGLFRPYGWPLCDAFLNDILDGFYPYEFKDKYPDGFPVEPLDHSREFHDGNTTSASSGGIRTLESGSHKPLSKEQFLKNLPTKSITRSGNVMDVHAAVQRRMQPVVGAGGTAARALTAPTQPLLSTIKGDTAAASELTRRQQAPGGEPAELQITTVQIRLPGGEKCILHMFYNNTISDVRSEFKKAVPQLFPKRRNGNDEGWYELRSMFPRVECTNHAQTLQELELVPSCTLMLRISQE